MTDLKFGEGPIGDRPTASDGESLTMAGAAASTAFGSIPQAAQNASQRPQGSFQSAQTPDNGKTAPRLTKSPPLRSDADWAAVLAWTGHVDEIARRMETHWGLDRLPRLVEPELATKFHSQAFKYRDAVRYGSPADVQVEAQRMTLAWSTLDKAARDTGKESYSLAYGLALWEVESLNHEGKPIVVALVRSNEDAKVLLAQMEVTGTQGFTEARETQVWTMQEVSNLIAGFPDLVKIKHFVKGSEVQAVRVKPPSSSFWSHGDDLPEEMGGPSPDQVSNPFV